MPEFPLTLRSIAQSQLQPKAWYLPSGLTNDWLAEVVKWRVRQSGVRFVPIPASIRDREPVGVLIIADEETRPSSSLCLAFKQVAGNLYIPADSQLQPAVDQRELTSLLETSYIYVWHPGVGLVAADAQDVLSVKDLLAPLRRSSRNWSRAVPGVAVRDRLTMITARVELDPDSILDQGKEDIGSETQFLDRLPKAPQEPGSGPLNKAGRALSAGASRALYALTKLLPGGGSRGSWADKLHNYAAAKLNQLRAAQEHLRNKEIARLLHMLKDDPDRGLRFALPMFGGGNRGIAPPSDRLSKRNVHFDLRRLGRGSPVDHWNIDWQYQHQLITRYRELANREMQMGRYRRAAYIFAELLNDLDAAALALATGQHFREAAVIYRDHLRRPLDAAKCLENGGLWSEAIEEYEKLQMHEHVGDLHARIGNDDKAKEAYRIAAQCHHAEGDFLAASRIWERKLLGQQQAIAELRHGWPHSSQAIQCARALFASFARTGDHKAAEQQIDELVAQCPSHRKYVSTADVLAGLTAGAYPQAAVRHAAGRALQRVVSEGLRGAPSHEARQLTAALSKLAPSDRLLERDCRRFVNELLPSRGPRPQRNRLLVVTKVNIGLNGCWRTAHSVGDLIVAAGVLDGRIILARSDMRGNTEKFAVPWGASTLRAGTEIVLVADPIRNDRLGLYAIGKAALSAKKVFGASDRFGEPITVGALPGVDQPLGVTCGARGYTYSVERRERLIVQVTSEIGKLVSTYHIHCEDEINWDEVRLPLPMVVRRAHLYLALGSMLVIIRQKSTDQKTISFPTPIRQLAASAEHSRSRLVVGLGEGGHVEWEPASDRQGLAFASGMFAPCVGINRGGFVIAAADKRIEVYDSKEGKLAFVASYDELPDQPVAVVCGTKTNQFAVLTKSGYLFVMEV